MVAIASELLRGAIMVAILPIVSELRGFSEVTALGGLFPKLGRGSSLWGIRVFDLVLPAVTMLAMRDAITFDLATCMMLSLRRKFTLRCANSSPFFFDSRRFPVSTMLVAPMFRVGGYC